MMLKKQQPLEDSVITEPETPPPEAPAVPAANSHLIHRIIASNEALIQQQMMAIRDLQTANADLEHRLKLALEKYDTLYELAFARRAHTNTEQTSSLEQSHSKTSEKGQERPTRVAVEDLLMKIADLEQQLSTTKVELAVKSAELLTNAFNQSHEDSAQRRRKTLAPESSKADIERYFEPLPCEREEEALGKLLPENKEIVEAWNKLLEQYGSEQKAVKFREKAASIIKKSIPRQQRGRCWGLLVQNRIGMSNGLYLQLLERREKGWVCEKVRAQIEKDIRRSFYGKTHYETKTGFILEVVEFLEIFHLFRPDISYVQGMTYPAMVLIPVLGKIRAFTLFSNLILGNPFLRRLFAMQGSFVGAVCRAFQGLLEDALPSVAQQLSSMGVQSQIFLIQWLFTFFSRGLSLDTTLKFWDQLLFHQEVAFFRMGLSIFEQLAPELVGLDYQHTVSCVREYSSYVREEKVVEGLVASKLTAEKMQKFLEKAKH